MSYKIALVEDDPLILEMVRVNLQKQGYLVAGFNNGEAFLGHLREKSFDLIILDMFLPGIGGLEILKLIKDEHAGTPVLFLTVESTPETKVKAFLDGADDYLTKPFNLNELLARVKAILRRTFQYSLLPAADEVKINNFRVNLVSRTCQSNLGEVSLSEKEVALLKFFTDHPGKTLTRADILEEIWGMDVFPSPRTVDNFVLKFRKLFESNPKKPRIFIAIRPHGYGFFPHSNRTK